jgi:hypothetical protein
MERSAKQSYIGYEATGVGKKEFKIKRYLS